MTVLPSSRRSLRTDRSDASSLRVLVADDDASALDLFRHVLEGFPPGTAPRLPHASPSPVGFTLPAFEVTGCLQGPDAVEAVRAALQEERPFSVVFLDMRMPPGPDGLWTAIRIRALDPHVNIVMVTAFLDVAPEEMVRRVPPADKLLYIQKPFHAREIQQFAVALSAKWEAERQIRDAQRYLEIQVDERTAALEQANNALTRDIQERHRAEEALRASEARLRRQNAALVELALNDRLSTGDLAVALRELVEAAARTLDAERVGVWLYTDDGAIATGVASYELATHRHSLPPDLSPSDFPAYFSALESGRTLALHDACSEPMTHAFYPGCRDRSSHASRLDASIRLSGRVVGFISLEQTGSRRSWTVDEESFLGSLADFAALALETAERKRKEETLRRLKRAVEQSIDRIVVADLKGRIVYSNRAWSEMHGRTGENLIGTSYRLFHTPQQIREQIDPLLEAAVRLGSCQQEVTNLRLDGSEFPSWMSITLLRDESESPEGYLVLARDVTEMKRAEERGAQLEVQLQRSQKMEAVGRLAGGIAHDFNNMLMAIIGCSEFLLSELDETSDLRRDAEEIKKAGERAASLTRQLLAFSRRQVLQPRVLDLNTVVMDVETMLRRVIGEHIELSAVLDPHLWRVKADPSQLEQVIINLALNARDAMPGGGMLTLETHNVELGDEYRHEHVLVNPGPYVMLAVTDTGVGMDPETQAHVFEPFFTTKGQGKGTGLGLATVYGTIKQSGGYIWVYSEPGQGTTFRIYLPQADGNPASATGPARDPASLRGTETVLLVEDDEVVRDLVLRILRTYGYTVLVAAHVREALRICDVDSQHIDLMLTDVVMPQMSGRELAQAVAARRPGMKVLYMSGYSSEAVVRHNVVDRGAPFLQKPFTPDTLARKLREVFAPTA